MPEPASPPSTRRRRNGSRVSPRVLVFALTAAGAVSACAADRLGGECAVDDDCGSGEVCLLDLKRSASASSDADPLYFSYCSRACERDRDCPDFQTCRSGQLVQGGPTELYCVDRVRSCADEDPKNGLDDDCDGVVDPADGPFLTRCLDDAPCGAFVCQAPVGQPETLCAPPNPTASVEDFRPCSEPTQCRSGLCESGLCSPLCRPGSESTTCPALQIEGRERVTSCARSVGPEARPGHNLCQIDCGAGGACPGDTACVWRDVEGSPDGRHFFVCASLDPGRLPLGASCPSNRPEDDMQCQYGLCFGLRCTRRCGGPGSDCSDVGSGFTCRETRLFYGVFEFQTFVCVESSP